MESNSPPPAIEPYPTAEGKSPVAAVLLEIFPGLVQVFGLGNIYAGNVKGGLLLMISYWVACLVNLVLVMFGIGLFSWPLTWLTFMILSPLSALSKLKEEEAPGDSESPSRGVDQPG